MIVKTFIIAVSAGLCACAQFRGPGNYKTGADYPQAPAQTTPPPAQALEVPLPAEPIDQQSRATFQLHWPVKNIRITQNFEPVKNPRHQGLDLGGAKGTPIAAAHEGRVVYTGRDFHGYGNMVLIEYDNEWATLYAHLKKIKVRQGQYVRVGTTIGTMGRTGHATGVHLHFELMHKKEPVDPLLYLNSAQYTARY